MPQINFLRFKHWQKICGFDKTTELSLLITLITCRKKVLLLGKLNITTTAGYSNPVTDIL